MQQNKHPVGTRDTRKKNWCTEYKMNKDKHGHSCNKGTTIIYIGRGGFHWILQDPIVFFFQQRPNQDIYFHKHWRSFHQKSYKKKNLIKIKIKKKMPSWKFLLNYSLSRSPSFLNYLFSIFWQSITLFSLWWRSNYLFSPKKWVLKYLYKKSNRNC